MKKLLALALIATVATVIPTSSQASGSVIVRGTDPAGDVRIYRGVKGLTRAQKVSIDVTRVRIEKAGDQARITVRVRKVISTRKFDQMFFIQMMEEADSPNGGWFSEVGFTTRGVRPYATYYAPDGESRVNCSRLTVKRQPRLRLVSVLVPWKCMPHGRASVSGGAFVGFFETDAPAWSQDRFRVPGMYAFG